jgi:hypothetical protein
MKTVGIALCLVTAFFILMQGCIKDDLTECGLSIRIQYTKNKDGADHLADRIDHLTLYIFDSGGTFVGAYPSSGSLYNGYTLFMSLKSGTYDFIVWGNHLNEDYALPDFVPGKTKEAETNLRLTKIMADNQVLDFPDSLYYGSYMRANVRPSLQEDQVFTIDLIKNTKKITVVASGLPLDEVDGPQFDCKIYSKNAGLRFDNMISDNMQVTYVPQTLTDMQSRQVSEFVVMREIQDRSTESRLVYTMTNNAGERKPILDASLVDMLLTYIADTNRIWGLDIEDEFVIEIFFDIGNYTTASITINGWDYTVADVPL